MSKVVAMWSGPRNISTAMMRAFDSHSQFAVSDEPFYGCYLARTGIKHPMGDEIIADMDCNYQHVCQSLTGDVPGGNHKWYQKHMTHHMLVGDDLGWTKNMKHCFLLRNPRAVVASYAVKRENPSRADIGIDRQWTLFDEISQIAKEPPVVINAEDVLRQPEKAFQALLRALDIAFEPSMLTWQKGRRGSDGIWASHWYHAVEASTGFMPYQEKQIELSPELKSVADAANDAYEKLKQHALSF